MLGCEAQLPHGLISLSPHRSCLTKAKPILLAWSSLLRWRHSGGNLAWTWSRPSTSLHTLLRGLLICYQSSQGWRPAGSPRGGGGHSWSSEAGGLGRQQLGGGTHWPSQAPERAKLRLGGRRARYPGKPATNPHHSSICGSAPEGVKAAALARENVFSMPNLLMGLAGPGRRVAVTSALCPVRSILWGRPALPTCSNRCPDSGSSFALG